jgi:hypothetical protein
MEKYDYGITHPSSNAVARKASLMFEFNSMDCNYAINKCLYNNMKGGNWKLLNTLMKIFKKKKNKDIDCNNLSNVEIEEMTDDHLKIKIGQNEYNIKINDDNLIGKGGNGMIFKINDNILMKMMNIIDKKNMENIYNKLTQSNGKYKNNVMRMCKYIDMSNIDNAKYKNKINKKEDVSLLFIMNEGIILTEFVNKIKESENNTKNKIKYYALCDFIDLMKEFNNDYLHLDLKTDNTVYDYDEVNEQLRIVLIDLDMIVDKNEMCKTDNNCDEFSTPFDPATCPIEYIMWMMNKKNKNVIDKYTLKYIKNNNKINYIGVLSIIYSVIFEEKWTNLLDRFYNNQKNGSGIHMINYNNIVDSMIVSFDNVKMNDNNIKKWFGKLLIVSFVANHQYANNNAFALSNNDVCNPCIMKPKIDINVNTMTNILKNCIFKQKEDKKLDIDIDKFIVFMNKMLLFNIDERPDFNTIKKSIEEILKTNK